MRRKSRRWSMVLAALLAVVMILSPASIVEVGASVHIVSTYQELSRAITSANSGDIIEITSDIDLPQTLTINKNLTLRAADVSSDVTITTSSGYRHFLVTGGEISFATDGIVIDGGGVAGGIRSDANHLILNTVIQNCKAVDEDSTSSTLFVGGGVYVSKQLTITGGLISNNLTERYGGGVYGAKGAIITVLGGEISNNSANHGGGVFGDTNSEVVIKGGIISKNTAVYGGGVRALNRFTMFGGELSDNIAGIGGGGGVRGAHIAIYGGTICRNTSSIGGGVSGEYIILVDGLIDGNSASNGGGINGRGSVEISGGEITNNSVARRGGGIYLTNESTLSISNGSISGNVAENGGGIYANSNSNISITGGKITANLADQDGGGIGANASDDQLVYFEIRESSVITNNRSSQAYQLTDPVIIAFHLKNIDPTVTWTPGFEYIYNNFDVCYTGGTPIDPPDPVKHTVTVIERYTDGTPDVVNTYNVYDCDPFTTTYNSTGAIQSFKVTAADAEVEADYIARTISIEKVDRDVTITMVFGDSTVQPPDPAEQHIVTVTETWADGSEPDRVSTRTVDDANAFYEVFSIPAGYMGNLSASDAGVNYNTTSGAVYIASVSADVNIEITYTPDGPAPASATQQTNDSADPLPDMREPEEPERIPDPEFATDIEE